jgi:hypothetical protein
VEKRFFRGYNEKGVEMTGEIFFLLRKKKKKNVKLPVSDQLLLARKLLGMERHDKM